MYQQIDGRWAFTFGQESRADDATWKEGDHPRAPDGKFGSGGGSAPSKKIRAPAAPAFLKNYGAGMARIATKGVAASETPEQIAEKIKAFTATFAHGSIAKYGNVLIASLEKANDLPPGSLGKAVSKGRAAETPAATQPAPDVPAQPTAPPPGSTPTRAASILTELDGRNAPDIDYKVAFSTGAKASLKRGETWRGRLVEWVNQEHEAMAALQGRKDDAEDEELPDAPSAEEIAELTEKLGFDPFAPVDADDDDDPVAGFHRSIADAVRIIDDLRGKGVSRADEFVESEHPRDNDGKFGSGGGGSKKAAEARPHLGTKKGPDGKRTTESGGPLPAHITKLRIPPAWTDVKFSSDPDAALLVTGKDEGGRSTSLYSAEHHAVRAAEKFARVKALTEEFDKIQAEVAAARKDPATRDVADCLALIMSTGIRPGSDRDTGAEVQAYGASTLEGRHVRVSPNGNVSLQYTGKHGVALNIPVSDPGLAKMLMKRKETAGPKGRVFGKVNQDRLLKTTKELAGDGFKTKDFRTNIGTSTALKLMVNREEPTDLKSYKKAVMDIAKEVSAKLGNTPVIALQSYIAPEVFGQWRASAGV